ncbi:alpha/beta hydrolase [Mangrovibacterium diazotrophicum]|uniref:Acetyl esterase/lipase n=1 Tax=Mangrovibacterium diazotrophicum TaxID=1261403 RepID=A0A419W342_9BACT|nr:dienelactone hydrolase family protein [Mangrovibacterium diazotrophicum]RKD89849.1 acetyl esterase/lipase [Mangrovibacterium diazotrophicum]
MKRLLPLFGLLFTMQLLAQLPTEQLLYPNGITDNPVTYPEAEMFVDSGVPAQSLSGLNRVYRFVTTPSYLIFPAKPELNRHLAVVIFPGGGLRNVWLDKEGTDIALWLSQQGITCMVVKYRTNWRDEDNDWIIDFDDYKGAVYQDACTSMLTLKALADSLNFDADKVGMMGFSAGGWLAERMIYKYYEGAYEWNPAFVALIYHGNNARLIKSADNPEKIPPVFMAIAENDEKLPFDKVISYLETVEQKVPHSELWVYPDGHHGFGLAYDESLEVSNWKKAFVHWVDQFR